MFGAQWCALVVVNHVASVGKVKVLRQDDFLDCVKVVALAKKQKVADCAAACCVRVVWCDDGAVFRCEGGGHGTALMFWCGSWCGGWCPICRVGHVFQGHKDIGYKMASVWACDNIAMYDKEELVGMPSVWAKEAQLITTRHAQ